MPKKSFLEEKYCELNHLKNLLQTYPKDYCETIIQVINKVCDEISEYLQNEKNIKKITGKNFTSEDMEHRPELNSYTIEEIAKFDGINGSLAYIAIDGLVYDVTGIAVWDNGRHYGLNAGKDVSKYFKMCHINESEVLKKLRVVGRIIE